MSKDERYDVSQHEGHTPGPWEEGEYIPSDEMIERFQNRELQGAVMQQGSNIMLAMIGLDDNGEKDRQLIAATPEILDALKKAYEEIDNLEWLLAKAHGEGNMVHSLVHLGVKQQVEKLQTENTRLRDSLFIINEDMKDCEVGGMSHVRKIINFVNDVCEAERITPHE